MIKQVRDAGVLCSSVLQWQRYSSRRVDKIGPRPYHTVAHKCHPFPETHNNVVCRVVPNSITTTCCQLVDLLQT